MSEGGWGLLLGWSIQKPRALLRIPELPKWTVPKWHEYSNTVKTNNPVRATTPNWNTNTANSKTFHREQSPFNIMDLQTFCSFFKIIAVWHEICPYQA